MSLHTERPLRSNSVSRRLLPALAVMVLAATLGVWLHIAWARYQIGGLFISLGADWALYYAQTTAFWGAGPPAIYDFGLLGQYLQPLTAYTTIPNEPLPAGHVPYPPLFAWLFTPFTWPAPPLGFALWTVLNLLGAAALAWRVAGQSGRRSRVFAGLLVLSSLPVFIALYYGQPVILLACAFGEAFLALRAGRDFRAGLLIGCLLIKPQYGLLIGPLLIWKRRWAAVAGAALSVGVIVGASWLVAGLPTLLAYPISVLEEDPGLRSTYSNAREMVNWRALVLTVAPRISEMRGLALTASLSLLTVAVAFACWRGPWRPTDRRFPAQITVLMLATILANFHSHDHGVTFLAVAGAAVVADAWASWHTRVVLVAVAIVPTLALQAAYLTGVPVAVSVVLTVLLIAGFIAVAADILLPDLRPYLGRVVRARLIQVVVRPAGEASQS